MDVCFLIFKRQVKCRYSPNVLDDLNSPHISDALQKKRVCARTRARVCKREREMHLSKEA